MKWPQVLNYDSEKEKKHFLFYLHIIYVNSQFVAHVVHVIVINGQEMISFLTTEKPTLVDHTSKEHLPPVGPGGAGVLRPVR